MDTATDKERSFDLRLPDDGKNRIYILGCGRSGTTLMLSLMTCFADTYTLLDEAALGGEDYAGRFLRIDRPEKTHVIKRASNAYEFSPKLPDDLWLLYVIRHPLDVFTSTLKLGDKTYDKYISTERWLAEMSALKTLVSQNRKRLVIVRYEDLVSDPDRAQQDIADAIGLEIAKPFSRYHENFETSAVIRDSMNGVRKPDQNSIDRWRHAQFKPYVDEIFSQVGPEIGWVNTRFRYSRPDQWRPL